MLSLNLSQSGPGSFCASILHNAPVLMKDNSAKW